MIERFRAMPLSRRLAFSYAGVFAVVLAVFAIVVRLAFVASLDKQNADRLDTMTRIGVSSIEPAGKGIAIGDEAQQGLRAGEELEWLSPQGRRIAVRGFVAPGMPAESRTAATPYGSVRAIRSDEAKEEAIHQLDTGLFVGLALAILLSVAGGSMLTRAEIGRLEASNERLREFTGDAAHELRGPLTALSSNAERGLAHGEAPERMASIVESTRAMRRLVDDLLILARADRSIERDLFVVDLNAAVTSAIAASESEAARKPVAVDVRAAPGARVYGNPDEVQRIIANLVENAVRYTAAGGRVDVGVERDANGARVRVRDTGPGIPPEAREHIFERFWRGDRVRSPDGGSGLGLAIARALAQRHNAEISVESTVGSGSTFTVCFPPRPPHAC